MTEISDTFADLRARNQSALIPYLTVGDPHPNKTSRLVEALIDGGADIVELGIPFSDPIADGPTIQNAVSRALSSGGRPLDALDVANTIREKHDFPLVLMTYYNPVFRLGLSKFLSLARKSGISGIIVPDLPVEESQGFKEECIAHNIDTIFLASPSTTLERLQRIIAQTSGYLYLISTYGVTGIRSKLDESVLSLVRRYDELVAGSVPLAVGFGISKPLHVEQIVKAGADGAIVGSAFVKIIAENLTNTARAARKLRNLTKKLKKATWLAK